MMDLINLKGILNWNKSFIDHLKLYDKEHANERLFLRFLYDYVSLSATKSTANIQGRQELIPLLFLKKHSNQKYKKITMTSTNKKCFVISICTDPSIFKKTCCATTAINSSSSHLYDQQIKRTWVTPPCSFLIELMTEEADDHHHNCALRGTLRYRITPPHHVFCHGK